MSITAVHITIQTENAAFSGVLLGYEVAKILANAASRFQDGPDDFPIVLMDSNGNRVGKLTVTEEDIED